jgi:hypothetical protein
MNTANSNNAPASATTSSSAPSRQTDSARSDAEASTPQDPSSGSSEADYLRQQSAQAKAAIAGAFSELKADLAKGVDPRIWMKTHPWITLASAAAAGFGAVAAVVPGKQEQSLQKLAAIERALNGAHDHNKNGNGNGSSAASGPTGLVGMLLKEVIGIVKPIVITLLTERIAPKPDEGVSEE